MRRTVQEQASSVSHNHSAMDNFVRIAIFSVVILLVASSDILSAFTSPKASGESAASNTGHENSQTVTSNNDVRSCSEVKFRPRRVSRL